jgi:hypothetical protein
MPKRSNDFQKVVAVIYAQVAPKGGRVRESAMLPEDGEETFAKLTC